MRCAPCGPSEFQPSATEHASYLCPGGRLHGHVTLMPRERLGGQRVPRTPGCTPLPPTCSLSAAVHRTSAGVEHAVVHPSRGGVVGVGLGAGSRRAPGSGEAEPHVAPRRGRGARLAQSSRGRSTRGDVHGARAHDLCDGHCKLHSLRRAGGRRGSRGWRAHNWVSLLV